MTILGKVCVNCTVAAVALLSVITVAVLVWTTML